MEREGKEGVTDSLSQLPCVQREPLVEFKEIYWVTRATRIKVLLQRPLRSDVSVVSAII